MISQSHNLTISRSHAIMISWLLLKAAAGRGALALGSSLRLVPGAPAAATPLAPRLQTFPATPRGVRSCRPSPLRAVDARVRPVGATPRHPLTPDSALAAKAGGVHRPQGGPQGLPWGVGEWAPGLALAGQPHPGAAPQGSGRRATASDGDGSGGRCCAFESLLRSR